jgi:hypothetical protein
MNVWELRCANINDFSVVVPASELDLLDGVFDIDGKPLDWMSIPIIQYADSAGRPSDLSPMWPCSSVEPSC